MELSGLNAMVLRNPWYKIHRFIAFSASAPIHIYSTLYGRNSLVLARGNIVLYIKAIILAQVVDYPLQSAPVHQALVPAAD